MSLRSSSQQLPVMSNAIGSSRESNPSRRICHLRAVRLSHDAVNVEEAGLISARFFKFLVTGIHIVTHSSMRCSFIFFPLHIYSPITKKRSIR